MNGVADAAISTTFKDVAGANSTIINTRYSELGLPGATITVYGDNELVLGTTTTSSTGSWTVTIPATYTALHVLVECSPPTSLSILQTGPHGIDNNTTVARVLKNATNVNFTFGLGSEHAQNSPDLALACFAIPDPTTANGNPGNTEPMVIRFPYINGGPLTDGTRQTAGSSVATNTGQNYYSATAYPPLTTKTTLTTFGQTGSVYGVAYDKRRNRLLTSAFERAYTGLGAAGIGGAGKLYVTTLATSGTATGTTVWLDLETALSPGVAGIDPAITAGLVATTTVTGIPTPVTVVRFEHNKIGHLSLGDLEFSADGRTVFVVNLFSKQIYGIPVNADGTPNIAGIRTYTPTNPCTGAAFTDPTPPSPASRPANALLGLGIHPENGLVYYTVTCTGQNASDLKGFVYSFDPTTATPVFTQELQIPLSFSLQTGGTGTEGVYGTKVNAPWSTSAPNTIVSNTTSNNMEEQPWLADVLFDIQPDGKIYMLVGGRNRFLDAVSGSRITTGQGIWIAALNNNAWNLETNGVVGSRTTANNLTLPWFSVRNGNGVFFNTNGSEGADGTGNLVAIPGFTEVAVSGIDNVKSGGNNGMSFMSRDKGSRTRDILLLGSLVTGAADRSGVYKANVWGEVEALLNPAPLEVGNYVFADLNKNGLQDPSDLPLTGVTVSLVEDTNADGLPNETAVASTTTDANGHYYFDQADGLKYDTKYVLVINKSTDFTTGALASMSATVANVSANSKDFRDSDGELFGANQYAKVAFTTGGPGENNHLFDFGFTLPPCAKPTLTAIPSQTLCQGSIFSMPLVSAVVSNTVTSVQWYLTNASGTSFTAISGATSLSLSAAQAVVPTVGQSKYYALIGQNGLSGLCSDTVFVNLALKATPVLTITVPSAATVTQCSGGTVAFSVSSNAVTPDNISLVYFSSPQSGTAMYTGGTSLGTITSTSIAGTKTLSFTATLPNNPTASMATLYVYAFLSSNDGACKLSDAVVVNIRPDFGTTLSANPYVCKGASATLVALASNGSTLRWSTGQSGVDLVTVNPVMSATVTSPIVYSVTVVDANGCLSTPASITITSVYCTTCAGNTSTIGGNAYQDYNADGTKAATDRSLSGITVTLFVCDPSGTSTQVATTTTDLNGAYSFTGLTAGTTYRVEFSNLPVGYTPTYRGINNGSTVQFVQPGTCNASLGLNVSYDYCQTDPDFAVVCFTRNNSGVAQPTIVDMKYSTGQPFTASNALDANYLWGAPTGGTSYSIAAHTTVATKADISTTLGLAWDRTHKQLLTGSFMRAYAPMQTNSSTNTFGEATLYKVDYTSGVAGAKSVWLDLETLYGDGFAGSYVADGAYTETPYGKTGSNPAKIGYTGLGSIQFARDGHEVYVVNLKTQEVLVIPVAADGTAVANTAQIKRFPLPTDGCPTGNWADSRPNQAAFGLGLHPVTNRVYATLTCTGPTAADLKGIVYSFDPTDVTPASTDFRKELTIPLNLDFPATNTNVSQYYSQITHPWEVATPNTAFYTNGSANTTQHTQPWLGEIEFDLQSNGVYGMMVATRNRYHDLINTSFYVTGGVLFRTANVGSEVAPQWTLEQYGTAGTFASGVNYTFSAATRAGANTSPENRFFKYVGLEGAALAGTTDYIPGRTEILMPSLDNVLFNATSGMTWLNRLTGDRSRDNHLLSDGTAAGYSAVNFTKANNWGGLVAMCAQEPIQIGNRVWRDDNQDGVQDPCEPPIPGAVVKLYNAAKTTIIASATTNAAGEYYFASATVVAGTSTSAVSTSLLTYNTTYGLVLTSLGTSSVVAGLSLTNVTPLTPGESGVLNSGTSLANNDAKLDVVGGISSPCIKLTTGGPGDSNHTYDFGLVKVACNLTVTAQTGSQSVCTGSPVTLTAQATPVGSYTYVWSAPAGATLTGGSTATATATASTAGLQTFTVTVSSSPSCQTIAIVSVQVIAPTTPTFSPVNPICAGAILSALPTTSLNGITGTWSPALINTTTTSYTFTPTGGQCATVAVLTGIVNQPTTLPTYQPTVICEGGSAIFSITPPAGATAYWTTPATTTISSGTVSIGPATVANSGTYTLVYTNASGCVSTTTKLVTVNPLPALSLAGSGCVSGNQSYTVLLTTTASSLTTNAGQLGVTISGNLLTVPVNVASFVVSASSAAGCGSSLPITAPACTSVCAPPSAGADQALCLGTTSTTLVSPAAGEQWSILQQIAGTSPVINQSGSPVTVSGLSLPGVYKFRLASTSVSNCSAVVTITVNAPTTLPVFTPIALCESAGGAFGVAMPVGASAYWTTPTNTTVSSGTVTLANVTVASAGTYTVHYTNASGCSSSAIQTVAVNPLPTLSVVRSGCLSDNQSYTVLLSTNGASLTTNAGQFGVIITGNLISSPIGVTAFAVSASSVAGCVITLPITAPGCLTTCTPPNPGPDQSFCEGPTTTTLVSAAAGEQWYVLQQVSGTTVVINQTGSPVTVSGLSLPGVYKFVLASTSVSNCSAVVTVTVKAKTVITPFSPSTLCQGDGLTFAITPAAGASAYWTTPASSTVNSSTVTLTNATTANSGTYTLYYINANGCVSAPASKTVVVHAKPALSVVSSSCVSGNQSYTVLLSTNGASLTTNAGQFGVTISGNVLTVPINVSGVVVSASSAAGCVTGVPITVPICTTVVLPASLGDYVFVDVNKNGSQDGGDTPSPGVIVTLITSGTVVATTTTNGSGLYSFTGLTPGIPYSVSFTTPFGYSATSPNVGVDDALDSDPIGGVTAPVTLTSGEHNPTLDAGFVRLTGSIGNYVWKDLNKNGQQDSGEAGADGVTVRLQQQTSPGTFTVVSTTVTAGGGYYLFTNLPAGVYVVEIDKNTLPATCTLSPNVNVGNPATDSDTDPNTGRSPLIPIDPTDPTKRTILTVGTALETPCEAVCIPVSVRRVR
ncbi:SdrD B-like domain-containing protein [uncultured Fibrella sp.]|uniref:SdrD B-like domain-containing protein n=1 Tax=uncultured Fibrella sp. TaxID=1284596 RepID=UPI0035CB1ACC